MNDSNIRSPYYIKDINIFYELRRHLNILTPNREEMYGKVEDTVSKQFIRMYGQYLNPEQIKYWNERQFIYTDHERAERFGEIWEKDTDTINPKIAEINGKVYTSYFVGIQKLVDIKSQTSTGSIIRHYWAGRLVVYPLSQEELTDVDPKWLMSQSAYDNLGDIQHETQAEFSTRWATIGPYVYTNSLGAAVVHEKVHGIQDYELPLPLLEGAANYYQLEVAKANGWEAKIGNNMAQFAKLYAELVDKVGVGVHRFLFGNIKDQEVKDEILKMQRTFLMNKLY